MDSKIFREAALAYRAVYDEEMRQELEEDNILQENAEIWVSECILNGVDFSQYTLDELTEAFLIDCEYLTEDAAGRAGLNIGAGARQLFGRARRAVGSAISGAARGAVDTAGAAAQGLAGQRTTSSNPAARLANTATRVATAPQRFAARAAQGFVTGQGSNKPSTKPTSSSTPSKFAGARDAAFKKAAAIKGSPVVGSKPSGGSSAPAARPASTAAARPAASAPTAKPAPTAAAKPSAAPAPTAAAKPKTPNPLMQKTFGYQTGKAPDQVAKTAAPTPAAKPTPTPAKRPGGSVKPGSLVSGFDMFDVVKGYLIDEGFAETEQAAIAIMANMSEEWKSEIIDEAVKGESSDRRRALAAERRKGIKPLSTKEGEKYASHKISQMAYTKRAKMGDDD